MHASKICGSIIPFHFSSSGAFNNLYQLVVRHFENLSKYSDDFQCNEQLTFGSDEEVLAIESTLTRKKTRDFSFDGNGYIGHLTSLTMDLTTDSLTSGQSSLRSSLEGACSMDNISQQPMKFYNLIVAMRKASESEISSLYDVLDGVCQNQDDLDATKLFHDALQSCGDSECVNFGTELILSGAISLEEARPWFLIWSMGNNQARFQIDASSSVADWLGR